MSSIVIELQNAITSSGCDIVLILRRAHVIAVKLGLQEFDHWISCELNGYPNQNACPDYRQIRGVLKAYDPYYGWIPTAIPDAELEKMVCEKRIPNSISEIVALCETADNGLISEYSGKQLELINEMFDSPFQMRFALHISRAAVMDIVEKVKNTVLEWSLKLEKEGVLGEKMKFSDEEKTTAKRIPQTINNYYGVTNVINAKSESLQIISGNENVSFSNDEAHTALSEIESSIAQETLSYDDKEAALKMLSDIRNKISQEKQPSVIKALLVGLKEFLINAGGSLTAGLIQAKIQGLF